MALLNYQTMFEQSLKEEDFEEVRADERVAELLKREEEKWAQNLELAKQQAFDEGTKQAWLEADSHYQKIVQENTTFYRRIIRRMGTFWLEQKEELMQALMATGFEVAQNIMGSVQVSEGFVEKQHQKILDLLHKVESHAKPVLYISIEDEARILELIEQSGIPLNVSVTLDKKFGKGEFILDTDHEQWLGVHRLIAEHFQTQIRRG